ncbi:von Willebrand factor type A domain protein [Mariniradius saccharolyticus AK6]|uniref:von Willebrand factor type A domain protein n=1 Tax=Mariniradius saccharolyticus AK6 TaxID=1239962 RepID=M7XEL6_9BACT|nr:von Willebrand factor type A domain protein [Mariniradius saccharolyticus AK6]
MKSLLLWLLSGMPLLAQTNSIKENLGPSVNTKEDQILPVFSLDGNTLYFSENATTGRYEIWFSQRNEAGTWAPKQKAEGLNPPTDGSKYVFAQVENDLLLVNGWFEQTDIGWVQSTGLSWYLPSQKRFVRLDIPTLRTQAKGRFVNAFLHRPTKMLLLSYAENERKDIYVCQPENPSAPWTELRWQMPERLPAPLNSEFDDTTPFLDNDGATLYFASNRPGGYGADDIYRSRRLGDSWTQWSVPENLGFRVNSNYSEIYYCIAPSRDFAYFVSYKHSYGSGDIFMLRADSTQSFPDIKPPPRDTQIDPLLPMQAVGESELEVAKYKANNLVFLIDRSGSMKGDNKLPLLKSSLKRLIGQLRDIDRLTLMSFADSAIVHFSLRGVTQKDSLYALIDSLAAAGETKANKGLELAYDYTVRNFVEDGNNEIILVTDGLFSLSTQDRQRINANRRIILSVVGLGNDGKALSNLRKLATGTKGSFIHIQNHETGTEALLEEVKSRSRR